MNKLECFEDQLLHYKSQNLITMTKLCERLTLNYFDVILWAKGFAFKNYVIISLFFGCANTT